MRQAFEHLREARSATLNSLMKRRSAAAVAPGASSLMATATVVPPPWGRRSVPRRTMPEAPRPTRKGAKPAPRLLKGYSGAGDLPSLSRFLDKGSTFISGKASEGFSDKELRDLVLNFLIAGRDTTACALSWTLGWPR